MIARIVIVGLITVSLIAGAALYYLQVYAFYDDVQVDQTPVLLTSVATGEAEGIAASNVRTVNSDSSPIRFRGCFETTLSQAMLSETYVIRDDADPLVAPAWFDCFDAEAIGADLTSGTAIAFMGQENVQYGIDRIVAIYPDGRGYAWHQINACGEVVFDGDPTPDDCPPAPEGLN